MKKLMSVLLLMSVIFVSGCGNKNEKYLEDLGFNVVSYDGEQIVNQDDNNVLYKSIVAVQYDKLTDESLIIHNYTVTNNNDSIQASLLISDGEIIGGYRVCAKGYVYSLDGELADVSGLYNN